MNKNLSRCRLNEQAIRETARRNRPGQPLGWEYCILKTSYWVDGHEWTEWDAQQWSGTTGHSTCAGGQCLYLSQNRCVEHMHVDSLANSKLNQLVSKEARSRQRYQADQGFVLVHPEEPAKGTATATSLILSRDTGPQDTGLAPVARQKGPGMSSCENWQFLTSLNKI